MKNKIQHKWCNQHIGVTTEQCGHSYCAMVTDLEEQMISSWDERELDKLGYKYE